SIVAGMAATLVTNNWQIGPVLEQLLTSEHFMDDNVIGSIIKSPIEFVNGAMRSLKLTPQMNRNNTNPQQPYTHDPLMAMASLSQLIFFPPNVKGWIGGRDWISSATVPLRIRYSQYWVEPINGSLDFKFDPNAFVRALSDPSDPHKVVDEVISLLLPI